MISQQQAEAIARQAVNRPDALWPDRPEIVITEVQPHRIGWLVFYQSQVFLDSDNISDALAGNGPVLVSKADGSFRFVGTAAPLEQRIAEAEAELLRP